MQFRYGKFYADWRDPSGIRHRKSFWTQREAKQYQQKMRDEIRALKQVPGEGRVTNFTLAWMEHHPHPNDQAAAKALIAQAGSMRLRELNAFVAQIIVGRWKRECGSPHTTYNYRYALRRLLKYLCANGAPQEVLVELPRVSEPEHRYVVLNDEEKFSILELCRPPQFPMWFRCFILNCLLLGLRRSEARRLAPMHYDSVSQRFYGLKVKNNKTHGMRVPGPLREIFESVMVPDESGFVRYVTPGSRNPEIVFTDPEISYLEILNGEPVSRWSVVRAWKKLKRLARLRENLVVHDLRRTGATFVMEHEGLLAAKEFLHHKSLGNTEAYLAFTRPKDLDRVLEDFAAPAKMLRFPPVAKKRSGSKDHL